MKNVIPELVKEMTVQYHKDAKYKGAIHTSLEKKLVTHRRFEQLRADWAEKRINSIFREVERYGVKILDVREKKDIWGSSIIRASYQDVQLEGKLRYVQMDSIKPFKQWRRPKIVLSFWVLDSKGERCYLEGHHSEALKIVFGKERMLTYNRLMPAILNAIAR